MIQIKNVYYMLAYAFRFLDEQGYKRVELEEFKNVAELCAAILSKGISMQLKRGLNREYTGKTDALSLLRGRIDIADSIKTLSIMKSKLICSYYDFSLNSYKNRIIKTTLGMLMHTDISKSRKKELRKLLIFFNEVEPLDIHNINWNQNYDKNNHTYEILISICYMIIKGLLQTNSDGKVRLMDFLDEQRMCRLYEKFIFEYYRKEFPEIKTSASQIKWAVDDGFRLMLPVMQTDIMLEYKEKVLIIDAKYYSHNTQKQFNTNKIHSGNLYQMFTYVKNADLAMKPREVSGLILYARTDELIQPEHEYEMSGNKIGVSTLDLSQKFNEIAEKLNGIAHKLKT